MAKKRRVEDLIECWIGSGTRQWRWSAESRPDQTPGGLSGGRLAGGL